MGGRRGNLARERQEWRRASRVAYEALAKGGKGRARNLRRGGTAPVRRRRRRDALEAFAANLRQAREPAGLTQERLAELADLHMTGVGRIERGERDPGARTVARLAKSLGLEPGELFEGVD